MGFLTWLEGRVRWLGAKGAADPGALWLKWGRRAHYKAQGLDYLLRSAELGNAEGQLEMGLYYASGGYGSGGTGYALEWFRRSAEQGHREAGYHLAEGLRWAGRSAEALTWYRWSGDGGFGPAIFWLVRAYEYADGVELQDLEEAARWRTLLEALKAYPPPRRSALMAQPEDPELDSLVRWMRAVRDGAEHWVGEWVHQPWFPVFVLGSLGVLLGSLLLMLALLFIGGGLIGMVFSIPIVVGLVMGLWFWWGLRRGRNYSKRQQKLWIKAFQGDPESCYRYGLALKQGTSDIPKDAAGARSWFEKAARQGHLEGMLQLAELQRWGAGGLKQTEEARKWLQQAAAAGHPGAVEQLKGIAPLES